MNLLEFMAAFLTIQFALSIKTDRSYPHRILSFTDSSSTLGQLFRSNFNTDSHKLHDKVARDLAWFCTNNNVSLFGQHIPGENNIIADSLSRDFHLNDSNLTATILSFLPKQEQQNFKILNHPTDITSWMDSLECGNHTKQVCCQRDL